MTTPIVGRLYQYKNPQTAGYFMVMSKGPTHIEMSPLFWREEIVSFFFVRGMFNDDPVPAMFERITHNPPALNDARICGRYDKECHRRWQIIADGKPD